MSTNLDRRQELLADDAVLGLTPEEQAELAALDAELDAVLEGTGESASWQHAVAALDVAYGAEAGLPAGLRAKLVADAETHFGNAAQKAAHHVVPMPLPRGTAGSPRLQAAAWPSRVWVAAAACLLLGAVGMQLMQDPSPKARHEALKRTPGALPALAWSATKDPAAAGASGEVSWNNQTQQGYMVIRGLQANDVRRWTYQLWIFDASRDDRYPVDGGVFDIPAGATEVVVPIQAKLPVNKPALFAVTVEKPGGVVVSGRERIVLAAKVGA